MEYAGLDLHKSFCQVLVCEKEGELIKEGRIKTETKDIAEFFSGLEDLTIAFEASSNYEYFYDLLEGLGHKVVLAHPLKTKMIAETKIKTDKIDAKTLAELLRGDFLPTSYVPPKEIRALRHLVRHRISLGKYRGIIKNQIKTPEDAPLESKCLQLSIQARSELRDKIAYYYARIPKEDKILED